MPSALLYWKRHEILTRLMRKKANYTLRQLAVILEKDRTGRQHLNRLNTKILRIVEVWGSEIYLKDKC